jgi:glycosyltransferase involved in cell wall biosynthesis
MRISPDRYPKITALICTLNEEPNLPHVLPRIPAWVSEVLVIDGHSTDKTIEVARKIRPDIRVMSQPGRGKGDALRYGIEQASGDIIVTMDADGSTDPDDILRFIVPLLDGHDFVKGSRFLKGLPRHKPWHRIIGNWLIILVFDVMFFKKYTDLCSGYYSFWKKAINCVALKSDDGFEDEPLINTRVAKAGLKVVEVGYIDGGRIEGETNAPSWRQGLKSIKTIIRERFHG